MSLECVHDHQDLSADQLPVPFVRKKSAGMMSGEWLVEEVVWAERQGEHVVNSPPPISDPGIGLACHPKTTASIDLLGLSRDVIASQQAPRDDLLDAT